MPAFPFSMDDRSTVILIANGGFSTTPTAQLVEQFLRRVRHPAEARLHHVGERAVIRHGRVAAGRGRLHAERVTRPPSCPPSPVQRNERRSSARRERDLAAQRRVAVDAEFHRTGVAVEPRDGRERSTCRRRPAPSPRSNASATLKSGADGTTGKQVHLVRPVEEVLVLARDDVIAVGGGRELEPIPSAWPGCSSRPPHPSRPARAPAPPPGSSPRTWPRSPRASAPSSP